MDYQHMTAPCGLDCFNCLVYHANEDSALREMLAERLGIPVEQAVCQGCRNENGTIGFLKMTKPCNVYACTQKQNFHNCSECSDFPCDYLHPYADKAADVPHNTKVFNLCLIKKMGLETWAETKARDVKETYFKKPFPLLAGK